MNLSLPQLVIGCTGAVLIYAAVKNVSPVQVVKDALSGKATQKQEALYSFGADGSVGLGPAFGTPLGTGKETQPSGPIGLPPIPGMNLASEGVYKRLTTTPVTSGLWKDPKTGKL